MNFILYYRLLKKIDFLTVNMKYFAAVFCKFLIVLNFDILIFSNKCVGDGQANTKLLFHAKWQKLGFNRSATVCLVWQLTQHQQHFHDYLSSLSRNIDRVSFFIYSWPRLEKYGNFIDFSFSLIYGKNRKYFGLNWFRLREWQNICNEYSVVSQTSQLAS